MLMNQKLGQHRSGRCMSPQQYEVAQAMKINPPPSLLDKPADQQLLLPRVGASRFAPLARADWRKHAW